jgi:hypothetical protein
MENPLYKLHLLLEQAHKESTRSHFHAQESLSFKETWSKVLDIDPNDNIAFMNAMSSVFKLLATSKEYIEKDERLNKPRNIDFLNKVGEAFSSLNFDSDMKHFRQYVKEETIMALSLLSDHIHLAYNLNESVLTVEEVNDLINEIDNLIDKITNSNLSEQVTLILFKNLSLIRTSLNHYKVSGIKGVEEALEQALGSILLNKKTLLPVVEDENVQGVFGIISKINSVLSVGVAVKELVAPLVDLITSK